MFKWILGILLSLGLVLAGLYGYFIRAYTTAEPPESGQLQRDSLMVSKLDRSFSFYLPETLGEKPALVFVLHGSMGHGDDIRWQTAYGFERLAQTENFIPVYPDGFEHHWNDCRASASYSANTQNINDPAFFAAMVAYFKQRHAIDEQRVFVTGLSNGGHMAYRLALETPELIRAIAPIAASMPVNENNDCGASGKPMSVAVFNGTNDPINPYEGGLVELMGDSSRGSVLSSEQTIRYWRNLAGVPFEPARQWQVARKHSSEPAAEVTEWLANGETVRLYKLWNSGHVVPSPQVHFGRLFGGNAPEIEAADEIWGFFNGLKDAGSSREELNNSQNGDSR
ncbi:alpha/beta hydrolase family esterase [Pseudomaricurvus sp.]|uniref:alpha/beta hydrolase family esterase n=1 Tax=Pseudomaricurvus sp. TaxID=2004510 RepID=UPI003F6C2B8D